jgi:hypothetical protein
MQIVGGMQIETFIPSNYWQRAVQQSKNAVRSCKSTVVSILYRQWRLTHGEGKLAKSVLTAITIVSTLLMLIVFLMINSSFFFYLIEMPHSFLPHCYIALWCNKTTMISRNHLPNNWLLRHKFKNPNVTLYAWPYEVIYTLSKACITHDHSSRAWVNKFTLQNRRGRRQCN